MAVLALLGADPGEDLPGDLVLGPDLLIDAQKIGGNVPSRRARGCISSPTGAEQVCPTNTEIRATPIASTSGTAAATVIKIQVERLRVMTGTAVDHPPPTWLTSHPRLVRRTVSRTA